MSSTFKVAFVDTVHPILWERLTNLGCFCEDISQLPIDVAIQSLSEYQGVVIRSRFKLDESLLGRLKNLKFIARAGSGLENIDTGFCKKNNITVFSSPEGNRDAVAEHSTGMLLMLLNHLKRADNEVRAGIWKRAENRGTELKNQVIGIIGYGFMGKAFAQRLSGFGCKVLAYDKFKSNYSDQYASESSLEQIQQEATVVSLHVNYLEENKYLINDAFIHQMNHPFIVINTARGFNVHTPSLVDGLEHGKVLGACLDVLEYESVSFENLPSDSEAEALRYLKDSDKVVLTPHIAGWTHESNYKLSSVLADKIEEKFF